MTDWRPIETAPKDGRDMLCVWENGHMEVVAYNEHARMWRELYEEYWPTHWMPLPPAPSRACLAAAPEG